MSEKENTNTKDGATITLIHPLESPKLLKNKTSNLKKKARRDMVTEELTHTALWHYEDDIIDLNGLNIVNQNETRSNSKKKIKVHFNDPERNSNNNTNQLIKDFKSNNDVKRVSVLPDDMNADIISQRSMKVISGNWNEQSSRTITNNKQNSLSTKCNTDDKAKTTELFSRENNDIRNYLDSREQQKIRLSKRRESIRRKRFCYENVTRSKTLSKMEVTEIWDMIQKAERQTPLGNYKRIAQIIDIILAGLILVNIVISIMDNELYIKYSDDYWKEWNQHISIDVLKQWTVRTITREENFLRILNIGISLAGIVFIVIDYHLKIIIWKAENKWSKYDNLYTSGLYKYCAAEVVLVAIFFPPFINQAISGQLLELYYWYNYNAIISVFIITKCYIILRVYLYFSRWTSDSAKSIGVKYNLDIGLSFALKAEMKKRPYTILIVAWIIVLWVLSFCVRTFEYSVFDPGNNSTSLKGGDNDLQNLSNCFWLIIITMITVGYGDMFPKSHLGRGIVIIASVWGMWLVSWIVVSWAVWTEFTEEEKKAYHIIKKIQADSNAFQKAANVICDICKLRYWNERKRKHLHFSNIPTMNTFGEQFIILTQWKKNVSFFKNDFKVATSFSIPWDDMLQILEMKLTSDLKVLNNKWSSWCDTEETLHRIQGVQDNLERRMCPIWKRQERIAKYIIDLNNKKYITAITRKRRRQRRRLAMSTVETVRKISVNEVRRNIKNRKEVIEGWMNSNQCKSVSPRKRKTTDLNNWD